MGGAGVCYLFPILLGMECEEEGPRARPRPPDRTDEGTDEQFARTDKGEIKGKKTDFSFCFGLCSNHFCFCFFYIYIYMLVPENTDIYGKWFFT